MCHLVGGGQVNDSGEILGTKLFEEPQKMNWFLTYYSWREFDLNGMIIVEIELISVTTSRTYSEL